MYEMDSLYHSLANDLGVPVSSLPLPPPLPPTPYPYQTTSLAPGRSPQFSPLKRLAPHRSRVSNPNNRTVVPFGLPRKDSLLTLDTPPGAGTATFSNAVAPPSPTRSFSSVSSSSSSDSLPPFPMLRRRPTPRERTLRELRARESEACLQRAYEAQTLLYLEGPLFKPRIPPKSKLRSSSLGTEGTGEMERY